MLNTIGPKIEPCRTPLKRCMEDSRMPCLDLSELLLEHQTCLKIFASFSVNLRGHVV